MNEKLLFSDFIGSSALLKPETHSDYRPWVVSPHPRGASVTINTQQKLGFMAEALFEHYLDLVPNLRLTAKNHQLIVAQKTLGEIDFVVKRHQEYIHIELAYKFYLWHPEKGTGFEAWIGPNDKDRLDIKCQRLFEHQLPLAKHPQIQEAFKTKALQSQYCLLGQLFSPWGVDAEDIAWHPNINPEAWSGYWCTFQHFQDEPTLGDYKFFPLRKWQYFLNPQTQVDWKTYKELLAFINQGDYTYKTQLLWYKTPKGNLGKLFITQIP